MKVGSEIAKFQKEIEKSHKPNEKVHKKASRSASSDSLLSMDEGSDNSSILPPALPPKSRFLSSDNLSQSDVQPPALPPKKQQPLSNLNKAKTKVFSASTRDLVSTVSINNSDTECMTDGSVAERIKTFMNKSIDNEQALNSSRPSLKVRPRRSMQDLSSAIIDNQNHPNGNKKSSVHDLPKDLPSVRNLASIFSHSKSPEPLPRKSIKQKVRYRNYFMSLYVL